MFPCASTSTPFLIKSSSLSLVLARRFLGTRSFQIRQCLIYNFFSTNMPGDCFAVSVVSYKFLRRGKINAVNVSMGDRWSAGSADNLLCSSLACHSNDLSTCGTSHNTVINQEDNLILKFRRNGAQLPADGFLARTLTWHDERPEDVSVLNKSLAIR